MKIPPALSDAFQRARSGKRVTREEILKVWGIRIGLSASGKNQAWLRARGWTQEEIANATRV